MLSRQNHSSDSTDVSTATGGRTPGGCVDIVDFGRGAESAVRHH